MTETRGRPEPKGVEQFAHFFKSYMSISSVVAAALPIPVTAVGLIPMFESQSKFLMTYTSMICFLCLGFFFYSRHSLANRMFPDLIGAQKAPSAGSSSDFEAPANMSIWAVKSAKKFLFRVYSTTSSAFVPFLPLALILFTLWFIYLYHYQLNVSILSLRAESLTTEQILKDTPFDLIPDGSYLGIYYVGIFLCAESAFIIMALKEYLQDLVGLSDTAILTGSGLPEYLLVDEQKPEAATPSYPSEHDA